MEIYRIIEPYLAALGLTALTASVIVGSLYAVLRWFGEKWVTQKFSERLEAFKHMQQQEIEHLKFQINASMDRAVKLHQREFETLPEAWSKFLTSYNTIYGFTSPLQSYADVRRMTDTELDEFLDACEFSNSEKSDIKNAADRDKVYQDKLFWQRANKAFAVCRESNEFLQKNAIFMQVQIREKFDALTDLVWDALVEHKIRHEMQDWKERQKRERLEKEGATKVRELEAEIQKRLWSDVQISDVDAPPSPH